MPLRFRDLLDDPRVAPSVLSRGGPVEVRLEGATRDSREAGPGRVFVAIRGARFDGHAGLAGLAPGGAAILDDPAAVGSVPPGVAWALVADTRAALGPVASAVHDHPCDALDVVAVTGTNGKTTVTTLLAQALEATGEAVGLAGTLGVRAAGRAFPSALTTPEPTLLFEAMAHLRGAGGRLFALEASSIGLDLRRLDGVTVDVAVFTNLGRDHLDVHGTMAAYAAAKSRLFTERLRPPGGAPRALVQADDDAWRQLAVPPDHVTYGFGAEHPVRVVRWVPRAGGCAVTLATPDGVVAFDSPLLGRHNALNLAAALGAAWLTGRDPDTVAGGLAQAVGPRGRMEPVPNGAGLTVLVDYAHTPDALGAALASARAVAQAPAEGREGPGALWVVFGCGGDRDRGKRPEMGRVSAAADHVVVTSDNPRTEDPEAIVADIVAGLPRPAAAVIVDRAAAIAHAVRSARPGDVILVAGKGHETYQEVAGARRPFDDREAVGRALEGR